MINTSNLKFGGIEFCQDCQNMLYPKENKEERRLYLSCRTCQFQKLAEIPLVHVSVLEQKETDVLRHINSDVMCDPTLPKTEDHPCPKCNHNEAVFFMPYSPNEDTMRFCYVCTNKVCKHMWRE